MIEFNSDNSLISLRVAVRAGCAVLTVENYPKAADALELHLDDGEVGSLLSLLQRLSDDRTVEQQVPAPQGLAGLAHSLPCNTLANATPSDA